MAQKFRQDSAGNSTSGSFDIGRSLVFIRWMGWSRGPKTASAACLLPGRHRWNVGFIWDCDQCMVVSGWLNILYGCSGSQREYSKIQKWEAWVLGPELVQPHFCSILKLTERRVTPRCPYSHAFHMCPTLRLLPPPALWHCPPWGSPRLFITKLKYHFVPVRILYNFSATADFANHFFLATLLSWPFTLPSSPLLCLPAERSGNVQRHFQSSQLGCYWHLVGKGQCYC